MSLPDTLSLCSSSRFDTRSERGHVMYSNNHCVDILYNDAVGMQRNLLFTILNLDNALKLKVRDTSDFGFNYTALIDWPTFEQLKRDQLLDIAFEDFQPQIIDLLKQTASKKMLMKVEAYDSHCKVIFFEKSRIKSLILLVIDLTLTNQKELVEEMSTNIVQLKDVNRSVSTQLSVSRTQLRDTEALLKNAVAKNAQIEKQFQKDLENILQTFLSHLCRTETSIALELTKLTKRHQKLLRDVEVVKKDNSLRCQSSTRLVQSLQNLRLECETHQSKIDELISANRSLNNSKVVTELTCSELQRNMAEKDKENESMQIELNELKRDIQDATMIIAQKTKTNDEIGKDLVQANQVIVNFNNRYDILSQEVIELREKLNYKETVIGDQGAELARLHSEFDHYRNTYNDEDIKKMQHELFHSRKRVEELEKQNREAVKLNGLLTNKLSTGEILDSRNLNRVPPNY